MTSRDPELDRITTQLGKCLGRIDEQAYRLQQGDGYVDDFEICDALEEEAAMLQQLIGSVMQHANTSETCDLNRIVEHSLRGCVAEIGVPVVVRQNLARHLPKIPCAPGQLAFAVQRALMLALGGAVAGDEIAVDSRVDGDSVLLEIESSLSGEAHLDERAATLGEFVADLGGSCRIDTNGRSACLIAMVLPAALVAD